MGAALSSVAGLVVVGANHRSSGAPLRDRLFVEEKDMAAFLEELRAGGVGQALLLSTCDRVEVQALGGEDIAETVIGAFATRAGMATAEVEPQTYCFQGEAALRHLFAVAASLDSLVIGEPQVLGQVKASHRLARAANMIGPELDEVLCAAYGAAKRVRRESAIAEGPVSLAAAAVQVARDLHGDLAACTAVLIGDADMAELIAQYLQRAGISDLVVAAKPVGRAQAAARRLGGHFADVESLPALIARADILLSSVGDGRYQITADALAAALRVRRRRPIFLVDLAIPQDIEPAVGRLDEAFLYSLDDLEGAARDGQAARRAASEGAWRIVDDEVAAFLHRRRERDAAPAVTALRGHVERLRDRVLEETGPENAEAALRLFAARLLHDPSEVLRAAAAGDDGPVLEKMLRRLFRLGAGDETGRGNRENDSESD